MERNKRLKAADKCASRYTNENDARDILHVAEHFYELGLKAK